MYYEINWLIFFALINNSCAILPALGFGKVSNDKRIRNQLNKDDIISSSNHSHTKREGVYPYYSRPHFVSHSSHPESEYNNLYEIHSEYEDHGNPHYPSGPPTHIQHHHDHDKDLAIKALFAPLFGIALLGVVAAMINNPVLLQLGVLSRRRRRKRRNASIDDSPPTTVPPTVIDRLHNDLMTIGYILTQMPRSNLINEERRLLENYLTCSELGKSLKANEDCFKRVVCELWSERSNMKMVTSQRAFIKKLLADLLNNEYMQSDVTAKVKDAQKFGKENGYCEIFKCNFINTSQVSNNTTEQ